MDPAPINPYNAGPAQISSPVAPGSVMASPTSVDFALDFEDYVAWNLHKISRTPAMVKQRRRRVVAFVAIYLLLGIFLYFQLERWDRLTAVVAAATMLL